MEVPQLVEKFKNSPYLIGMGAGKLSKRFKCKKEDIYEARKLIKDGIDTKTKEESKIKGRIKSRWQNAAGVWLESYKFDKQEEDILDIEGILSKIDFSDIPEIKIDKITTSNFNINIYLSDQHIGAKVENGLYTNYFDADIYIERMNKVFTAIVEKSLIYKKFKTINIYFLGDTFDGQDGYTVKRTHQLPQNMSNNEAFELALDVNMKFIDKLAISGITSSINVYCVSDSNHGGSMDYYLFKSLQQIIKYKYPDIDFKIANKFIDSIKIGKHTFLYTHGKDGKDMKFGLPLYLTDKIENFINQYIDNYDIENEYIHFIKGDLHQNSISPGKKFRYRNVPSLFGSSGWIMKNYGNTKPGVGYDLFIDSKEDVNSGVITFK